MDAWSFAPSGSRRKTPRQEIRDLTHELAVFMLKYFLPLACILTILLFENKHELCTSFTINAICARKLEFGIPVLSPKREILIQFCMLTRSRDDRIL
jgi:hypothetical protein